MPICVVKSKSIIFVSLVLVTAVLLSLSISGASSAQVFFGYNARKVPIYNVDTTEKSVAISFDAAWGADKTKNIMDICEDFSVKATFFLVGFWVDKYPELVKEIDQRGFEIGTHSNTHPDMTTLASDKIEEELTLCTERIEAITNKKVELFRAPYGAYNNKLLDKAESLALKTIQWDVDSLDWKGLSAESITSRVCSKVKNGSIILCHNNSDHIVDALPLIFTRLQTAGFKVTNIGNLIYADNYIVDRNGVQRIAN